MGYVVEIHHLFEAFEKWGIPLLIGFVACFLWFAVRSFRRWYPEMEALVNNLQKLQKTQATFYTELHAHMEKRWDHADELIRQAAIEVSEKQWNECKEARCPKIDEFSSRVHTRLDQFNKTIHDFCQEGAAQRQLTAERMRSVEDTVKTFVYNMAILNEQKRRVKPDDDA